MIVLPDGPEERVNLGSACCESEGNLIECEVVFLYVRGVEQTVSNCYNVTRGLKTSVLEYNVGLEHRSAAGYYRVDNNLISCESVAVKVDNESSGCAAVGRLLGVLYGLS